jgi:hypothetical protein
MKTIKANAIQVLGKAMEQRKWYGDHLERRRANTYKLLLKKGKLSYEKAVQILTLIGYTRVEDEVWRVK